MYDNSVMREGVEWKESVSDVKTYIYRLSEYSILIKYIYMHTGTMQTMS